MYAAHGCLPAQMKNSTRAWISRVISSGHAGAGLEGLPFDVVLEEAAFEDVLPWLEWRLRDAVLPPEQRASLSRAARTAAAQSLFREAELRRVATVLERHGIRALLLKGNALGQWLYPQPYLRVSGDIDLLLESRAAAEQAAIACTELGYALGFSPAASNFEMTSRLVVDGISRSELDLHCRLLNSAAYADIFAFEELWRDAMPLPALASSLQALSPLHAFAHACLNRALDMQIGEPDRLKLLVDIHLLAERMDAGAWQQFLSMAAAKRISGICLRTISDTVDAFGSAVPADVLEALRKAAEAEPIDWRRLHDWRYMQWQNLKALPGTRAKLTWLWERVFLTHGHLRKLHGEGSWSTLMLRRMGRGLSRLRNKA